LYVVDAKAPAPGSVISARNYIFSRRWFALREKPLMIRPDASFDAVPRDGSLRCDS
jgi:hypothetical protein